MKFYKTRSSVQELWKRQKRMFIMSFLTAEVRSAKSMRFAKPCAALFESMMWFAELSVVLRNRPQDCFLREFWAMIPERDAIRFRPKKQPRFWRLLSSQH